MTTLGTAARLVTLRPYQVAARDAVLAEWSAGQQSTLLAMTMGTGKTEAGLACLQAEHDAGRLRRALWLAHRTELVTQPAERIGLSWPDLAPAGVVQAERDECAARIVVATVQTLQSPERLRRVLAAGRVSHVVVDEAHHSTSPTYKSLVASLRQHNPRLRVLGLTATPKRTDGDGLSQVFESVAYRMGIRDAVKAQALCPFVALAVRLPVSLAGVAETEEGWADDAVGEVLRAANAEQIVVETWQRHAADRPTMAFTASVAQAFSLARAFSLAGVPAEAACGETDREARAGVLQRFRGGQTRLIASAQLWTEGLDLPMTSCILQVRPTKSDLCYLQMIGRGLRLYPGKTEALILDCVPLDARDIRLAGDLLGKPRVQRKAEERAAGAGVLLDSFGIRSDGSGIDGDPDEVQLAVLDYLSQHSLAWTFDGGLASAGAGERTILAIRLPDASRVARADALRSAGQWDRRWERSYQQARSFRVYSIVGWVVSLIGLAASWEEASGLAEAWADAHADGSLARRDRRWRSQPATEKQRALLERWGLWREGLSRGAGAQAITHHICRQMLGSRQHRNSSVEPG